MKNTIEVQKITSLGELIEKVTPKKPDPDSGRLRENAVFRGMVDHEWNLLTRLDRLGYPGKPPHTKAHLEEHLLRNFIRHARSYMNFSPSNSWEWLVVAQHRGLPTRLLDWTYSPLVAAHFAVLNGKPQKDRVVWKLNWKMIHDKFHVQPFVLNAKELNEELAKRKFDGLWDLITSAEKIEDHFICLVEPSALDPRVVTQSANFTLSSDKKHSLDEILVDRGLAHSLEKYIIPAKNVDYIRDQLDICSIDERHMFPDLNGVASELSRYYSSHHKLIRISKFIK